MPVPPPATGEGAAVGDARSPQLTSRQAAILVKVVETYVATGQPVASRTLAADPELASAPSTIRNELALLEEHGLLAHPHTSAGRMPTDAGHRYVVDRLLAAPASTALDVPMSLSPERRELDEALRATTEALAEMNEPAGRGDRARGRAREDSPRRGDDAAAGVVMVVVITSSGGVSKFLRTFEAPIDPGLVAWAGEYLNDRRRRTSDRGPELGQRLTSDPGLGPRERAFVDQLAGAFSDLRGGGEDLLYIDGTSRLLGAHRLESFRRSTS